MRNRLSLIPVLLVVLVGFAGVPAVASADYKAVYTDCTDGTIDGHYTPKELQQALQHLEGNLSDYGDCADAITAALQTGPTKTPGKSTGSTGGSGTTAPSPGAGTGTAAGGGSTGTDGTTTSAAGAVGATHDASPTEQAAASAAATAAAAQATKDQAIDLQAVKVPASALQLGASGATMPVPLVLALVACAAAACLAGATTGVQAIRRRRGR